MELFSKSLTKTDVTARLSIPAVSLPRFQILNPENTNTFNIPVADSKGHVWRFRCSTRRTIHSKPVISGDWLPFVRANGLRVSDKVTFYEEYGAARVRFRVEVERHCIRFFGNYGFDKMATAVESGNSSGLNDITKESSTDHKSASRKEESYSNDHDDEKCTLARSLTPEELSGNNGDDKGKTLMAIAMEGGNSSGLNDVTEESSTDHKSAFSKEESYSNDHDDEKCTLARSLKLGELFGHICGRSKHDKQVLLDELSEKAPPECLSSRNSIFDDHDHQKCIRTWTTRKPRQLLDHITGRSKHPELVDPLDELEGEALFEYLEDAMRKDPPIRSTAPIRFLNPDLEKPFNVYY